MKSIIVGFSRPIKTKPFAWLIQKAYGINYDHVYIKIYSESLNRFLIYQASGTMVNFMGTAYWDTENIPVLEHNIFLTDDNYKLFMQFAVDNAGKPYGTKECFGLAWVRIGELLGKKWLNPFKDGGNTYVCSELVATILKDFNDATLDNVQEMSPLDVYNYIASLKV